MQFCRLCISLQVFGISNVSAKVKTNKQNIKISFEKNSLPSEWELMLSFPAEPVETRKL